MQYSSELAQTEERTIIPYAKDFLDLQVQFAQKIALLTDKTIFEAISNYTIIPQEFYFLINTKSTNPKWRIFVEGWKTHTPIQDWVYEFYLQRVDYMNSGQPRDSEHEFEVLHENEFGCFAYEYPWKKEPAVRIHFDPDFSQESTLSKARMPFRQKELRDMFAAIKRRHPEAKSVIGGSWLYHIDAYRRLFPPKFINTATPGNHKPDDWVTWGQFVSRSGGAREPISTRFRECFMSQTAVADCIQCFPYLPLRVVCEIGVFYEHYGIV